MGLLLSYIDNKSKRSGDSTLVTCTPCEATTAGMHCGPDRRYYTGRSRLRDQKEHEYDVIGSPATVPALSQFDKGGRHFLELMTGIQEEKIVPTQPAQI